MHKRASIVALSPRRVGNAAGNLLADERSLTDLVMRLQARPQVETARKGRILLQEDAFADHSMLLLEGWVGLSKMLPEGEAQIIDVLLPGDLAMIGARRAPVSAFSVEALSDARYVSIRPSRLQGPAPEMAMLRDLIAAEMVRAQARTAEILLRMGRGTAANRLAYALLEFHARLGAVGLVRDNAFEFPMTQQRLGEFVGLSNVHVCRTMRRFAREGIVSHPADGHLRLDDLDALCGIAGVDLAALRNEILARRGL